MEDSLGGDSGKVVGESSLAHLTITADTSNTGEKILMQDVSGVIELINGRPFKVKIDNYAHEIIEAARKENKTVEMMHIPCRITYEVPAPITTNK
jgi:hypothetical protein